MSRALRTIAVLLWASAAIAPLRAQLIPPPLPLTIAKTSAMVSDPVGDLLPKAIPGAVLDYTVTITNPVGGSSNVSGVAFVDTIPATTALRVSDIGLTGSGPIAFSDGSLLGLFSSNLAYSYTSLASTTDLLDFSNDHGTSWTYMPTPDADGYDSRVTDVRVRPTGKQAVGSYIQLRFRVRVR